MRLSGNAGELLTQQGICNCKSKEKKAAYEKHEQAASLNLNTPVKTDTHGSKCRQDGHHQMR